MSARADATESTDVESLAQVVEDLEETVERQAERIEELEETAETQRRVFSSAIAAQAERIGDLEEELDAHSSNVGGAFARIGDIDERLETVEETIEEDGSPAPNPTPDGAEAGSQTTETGHRPLERICALPEHVADRELTANQERARFIARDARDYAEKAPAGLVIDSRAIKRVLTASEGKRPHTQTVARVMDFLDDLGKDDVELIKRRGRKLVVVDPDAADRLSQCGDRGGGSTTGEGVIGPA